MQRTFNPIDYGFKFEGDWYKFDRLQATKAALSARNRLAKELREEGRVVRCFTLKDQLMSCGGIGSGNPHIELFVSVYGLNAY